MTDIDLSRLQRALDLQRQARIAAAGDPSQGIPPNPAKADHLRAMAEKIFQEIDEEIKKVTE